MVEHIGLTQVLWSQIKKVPTSGFTTDNATKEEFIKNEISLKVADQRKFLAKSVVCLNSFSDNFKTFQHKRFCLSHKECFVGSAVFQFLGINIQVFWGSRKNLKKSPNFIELTYLWSYLISIF